MTNKIYLTFIICVSFVLTFRLMRPGMWSVQDDLHIFRLSEYDNCLKSSQFPCRYSAHAAFGFGSPVFNFYPPITYQFADIFHLFGESYIDSIKIIYILPLFFGPIFMFLLASSFFGANGGLISALVFATAPYQALNLYVRGTLAENFALNLIPIIIYYFSQKKQKTSIFFLSLLLLTHQLTTFYGVILLFFFALYQKSLKQFMQISFWSLGLSSFFLLPSLFEKNLTTNYLMTQGYFNYIIHFATLKQLFIDRFWGYGASLWGPKDDMSFQIGYLQWALPLAAVICAFYFKSKHKLLILGIFVIGLFFTFLTHNKSTFIWQLLPFMPYFQFPWRFLGGVILTFSFISGSIILSIPKKFQIIVVCLIGLLLLVLNISFFHEDKWSMQNDSQKLTGESLIAQQGAGLTDFYPKYSSSFPTVETPYAIEALSGVVSDITFNKNPQIAYGQINVQSNQAIINIPVTFFPKMELLVDSKPVSYRIDPQIGLVQFDLSHGNHSFYLKFIDTPIRTISNYISLIFIFAFIIKLIRDPK